MPSAPTDFRDPAPHDDERRRGDERPHRAIDCAAEADAPPAAGGRGAGRAPDDGAGAGRRAPIGDPR